MLASAGRLDATALLETSDEILTVSLAGDSFDDTELAHESFREAIDEVFEVSSVQSVTVISEIWYHVTPRFSGDEHPPLRALRREGIVLSVETPQGFRIQMAEIDRTTGTTRLGEWRDVSPIYISGLTGFFKGTTSQQHYIN
jgi:hypothetical protein